MRALSRGSTRFLKSFAFGFLIFAISGCGQPDGIIVEVELVQASRKKKLVCTANIEITNGLRDDTVERLRLRLKGPQGSSGNIDVTDLESGATRTVSRQRLGQNCPDINKLKLRVVECVADDESCRAVVNLVR